MINGSDLRDFYIGAWRNIPDLVAAMKDEDEGQIRASGGVAKESKSLMREALSMAQGSILVAYQGCKPGQTRRGEITVHEIAAFIRAIDDSDDESIPFAALMLDSIPVGGFLDQPETKVRYLVPHIDADPMNMPRFERVSTADMTFDIWKLTFSIPENFE